MATNRYEMVLTHGTEIVQCTVEKLSFQEAAREAYMLRTRLGLDWEIISVICKNKKEKT